MLKLQCKWRIISALCAVLLMFSMCGAENAQALEAYTDAITFASDRSETLRVPLYFRLQGEEYLVRETREVVLPYDRELAEVILGELVEGPTEQQEMTAVFKSGTRALSLQQAGDMLVVTLSAEFLESPFESKETVSEKEYAETLLLRRLALQSFVNTLTEITDYTSVLFLVQRNASEQTGTRLYQYDLNENADQIALQGPISRNEQIILTHYNTASLILECWLNHDYKLMYRFLTAENAPSEIEFEQLLTDSLRTLGGYSLSPGTVSEDGQTAVFEVYLNISDEKSVTVLQSYPMRLCLENGLWKIEYDALMQMMEVGS